ncbi:hypothetical protein RUND412_008928 [Rhizina undulata]
MEQSRLIVFVIILLIVWFTPDGTPLAQRKDLQKLQAKEWAELEILRNSTFGKPGNLTGIPDWGYDGALFPPEEVRKRVLKMRDAAVGEWLEDAKPEESVGEERARDEGNIKDGPVKKRGLPGDEEKPTSPVTRPAELALYHNASGTLHGEWTRVQLHNLPELVPSNVTYNENVTGGNGKITFNIEEAKPGEVQEVVVTMKIKDESGGHAQALLVGVHFTKTGEMVLTTTSERFSGIFALPHFTLTESSYNKSKELVMSSIAESIRIQNGYEHGDTILSWQQSGDEALPDPDPKCEYIVYLQLHPVEPAPPSTPYLFSNLVSNLFRFHEDSIAPDILQQIERELRFPTGAPIPAAPPILLSSVIYSPTCRFLLETQKSKGIKKELFNAKGSNFALSASLVVICQILLLIRQMNESNTPSTVSRVSFWTMAMMATMDGYLTMSFLIVALFVDACFLQLASAAFFSFLLVSVFGMRFLMTIYRVQRPERRRAAAAAVAASQARPSPTPSPDSGLPLPVTATPQVPIVMPPAQDTPETGTEDDGAQEMGVIYSRFYFILLGSLFLSLHATSWPPLLRNIFLVISMTLANSYWVPQIYRNIMRGCRKAFTWEFVAGMSICRLMGVLYIFCYEGNVFFIKPDCTVAIALIGWVWVQVCVLASQEIIGPRFFVPSHLLPPAYDYHPILPIDDLEAALPSSSPSSPSSRRQSASTPASGTTRSFDCAICMQSVEVPTISPRDNEGGNKPEGSRASGAAGVGLLGRRNYMVTPCRHVFHSACLEGWMRFRLQCPICRNPLPPL